MRELSDDEIAQIRAASDAWVIALYKALWAMISCVMLVLAIFYFTSPQ